MNFQELVSKIEGITKAFDFKTLSHMNHDPFVLVSLVEPANGITINTFSFFLSNGKVIFHGNQPQVSLGYAMRLSAKIIAQIPFLANGHTKEQTASCAGFETEEGKYVVIAAVTDNSDDAEWVLSRFANSLKP